MQVFIHSASSVAGSEGAEVFPEKKVEPEPAAPPRIPVGGAPGGRACSSASSGARGPTNTMFAPTVSTIAGSPANSRPMTGMQVNGLVTAAAGITGIVTVTACWLVARSRHDDAVTYWNQGLNDAKATSLQSQAKDHVTAANVSIIADGALRALGVVLYFVGAPDALTVAPSTRAHLMPAVGPGFAGINAGGTW